MQRVTNVSPSLVPVADGVNGQVLPVESICGVKISAHTLMLSTVNTRLINRPYINLSHSLVNNGWPVDNVPCSPWWLGLRIISTGATRKKK